MGDLTAQRNRLKLYNEFLKRTGKWNSNSEYLKCVPGYDPGSLERAAAYFELDHADPSHQLMLAPIFADIVFGKRRPGRRKGDKIMWDDRTLWVLALTYYDLKSLKPDCTVTEIAKLLCDLKEFKAYKNNPEPIRQRLSQVRRTHEMCVSDDSEVWKAVWSEENAE
jgi:hypothetical protein